MKRSTALSLHLLSKRSHRVLTSAALLGAVGLGVVFTSRHHQEATTPSSPHTALHPQPASRKAVIYSVTESKNEQMEKKEEQQQKGKKRVVIVGAGVIGVTTAYYLARSGRYEVVVIERNSRPAMETSFANGGHVCPRQNPLSSSAPSLHI